MRAPACLRVGFQMMTQVIACLFCTRRLVGRMYCCCGVRGWLVAALAYLEAGFCRSHSVRFVYMPFGVACTAVVGCLGGWRQHLPAFGIPTTT
jgi:hypothetical protein